MTEDELIMKIKCQFVDFEKLEDLEQYGKQYRSTNVYLEIARVATRQGYFSVATAYCKQALMCVQTEGRSDDEIFKDIEESAWEYLLSRIRSDGIGITDPEVTLFKSSFPKSKHLIDFEDTFYKVVASISLADRLPIWQVSSAGYFGKNEEEQEKNLWSRLNNLRDSRTKILETAFGAKKLVPFSRKISQLIAQLCSFLGLHATACEEYKRVAEEAENANLRSDALIKAFRCLIEDKRFPEARELASDMRKEGISGEILSQLILLLPQDMQDKTEILADESGKENILSETEDQSFDLGVLFGSGNDSEKTLLDVDDDEDVSSITYPATLLGVMKSHDREQYFWPVATLLDYGWHVYKHDECLQLFPQAGAISVQNVDAGRESDAIGCLLVATVREGALNVNDEICSLVDADLIGWEDSDSIGYVVVYPENGIFKYDDCVYVTMISRENSNDDYGFFTGENVLIAVEGGLIGPFPLKVCPDGRQCVYPRAYQEIQFYVPAFADNEVNLPMPGQLGLPASVNFAFVKDGSQFRSKNIEECLCKNTESLGRFVNDVRIVPRTLQLEEETIGSNDEVDGTLLNGQLLKGGAFAEINFDLFKRVREKYGVVLEVPSFAPFVPDFKELEEKWQASIECDEDLSELVCELVSLIVLTGLVKTIPEKIGYYVNGMPKGDQRRNLLRKQVDLYLTEAYGLIGTYSRDNGYSYSVSDSIVRLCLVSSEEKQKQLREWKSLPGICEFWTQQFGGDSKNPMVFCTDRENLVLSIRHVSNGGNSGDWVIEQINDIRDDGVRNLGSQKTPVSAAGGSTGDDMVQNWLNNSCTIGEERWCTTEHAWFSWQLFAKQNGCSNQFYNKTGLTRALVRNGFVVMQRWLNGRNCKCYKGLSINGVMPLNSGADTPDS